ncbi:MAG TPA: glycosyl hydrolase family 79 C-terminal domain-containing protein [Solirubrobacteraceae bacterium]|nr:glycosyl hydrolase family 79 C-terminal domain-containing protein [Solirubrobacteraceae bacterium]
MSAAIASVLTALAIIAPARQAAATQVVSVGRSVVGRVQRGFLGLSMEIRGVEGYTGFDSKQVDPVFEQLIRQLDPGQHPVLRLGGDTTDWTWYPVRGMGRPFGARYALDATWFKVVKSLAQGTSARLILGVNLEAGRTRVAAAEANAMVRRIGRPWLQALQLGNEPDLYNIQASYTVNGVPFFARGAGWNFQRYLSDYARISRALPKIPLAGPEVGQLPWTDEVGQFLSSAPRVRIATLHLYALGCVPSKPATIPNLFSDTYTRGFPSMLVGGIAAAHAHGIPLRLDEMNTVSCAGQYGVSDRFAAALWILDALFELARAGVDGVNVHTREGTANQIFHVRRVHGEWVGTVSPEYYGLLAFARAAPAGSRLQSVTGAGSGPVHVWATKAPGAPEQVVLINLGTVGQTVLVRVPGPGVATLDRLSAPNVAATGHVTLGGQSVARQSRTGRLKGAPHLIPIRRLRSGYSVWLPAADATILRLAAPPHRKN